MRVSPVAGSGLFRSSSQEIVLGGRYRIPAGVMLIAHFYTELNCPKYWDRAAEFLPERWADPDAEYAAPTEDNGTSPTASPSGPSKARPRRYAWHVPPVMGVALAV